MNPGLKYEGKAVAEIGGSDYSMGFFRCDVKEVSNSKYCLATTLKNDARRVFVVKKFYKGVEMKDCTFYIVKEYTKKSLHAKD